MLIRGIEVCGLVLKEDIVERGLSSVSILPEEVLCRCLDFGLPSEMRYWSAGLNGLGVSVFRGENICSR